jgi:hypothetical protein
MQWAALSEESLLLGLRPNQQSIAIDIPHFSGSLQASLATP